MQDEFSVLLAYFDILACKKFRYTGLQYIEISEQDRELILHIGLYRHDGLAAFSNMGPRTADKIRKKLIGILKEFDLKITCETNLKIVNYLDVTLDLKTENFRPYRKPDNTPTFIHAYSNHTPTPPCNP